MDSSQVKPLQNQLKNRREIRQRASLQLLIALVVALERGHGRGRVRVRMVLLQRHVNIILEVELGLGIAGLGLKVNDQIIFHSKDRVDLEMGIIAGINLIDDGCVVGMGDHKVDMSRTHRGTIHEVEQHTGRAIGRQGIGSWMIAVPVELALLVGPELAAEVVLALRWILEVVLSVRGGLPYIEDCSRNGLAGFHIPDHTVHVGDFAVGVGVLDDAVAEVAEGGVGRPEGAEDDVGGGRGAIFGDDFVGDFVDETVRSACLLDIFISLLVRLTIPDRSRRRSGGTHCGWAC